MLYRVLKKAFDQNFLEMVENIVSPIPIEKGATVEDDDYSTRDCDLRWILYGTPGFDRIQPEITNALAQNGEADPGTWAYENLQYTAYGPNDFHNWHVDAYRRSYNRYDTSLGQRFIRKTRKISVSILFLIG